MVATGGEIDFHGFLGLVGRVIDDAGEDGQLPFGPPGRPFTIPERVLSPALHLGQYHLPRQRRQPQGLQFLAVLLLGHICQVIDHSVQLGFPFHLGQLDASLQSGVHQPAGLVLCFCGYIAALQQLEIMLQAAGVVVRHREIHSLLLEQNIQFRDQHRCFPAAGPGCRLVCASQQHLQPAQPGLLFFLALEVAAGQLGPAAAANQAGRHLGAVQIGFIVDSAAPARLE